MTRPRQPRRRPEGRSQPITVLLFSKPGPLDSLVGRCRGDSTGTSQPAAASPATVNEDGTTTLTLERQDVSTVARAQAWARHPLRPLIAYGGRDRRAATRARRHRDVPGLLSAPATRLESEGATPDARNRYDPAGCRSPRSGRRYVSSAMPTRRAKSASCTRSRDWVLARRLPMWVLIVGIVSQSSSQIS